MACGAVALLVVVCVVVVAGAGAGAQQTADDSVQSYEAHRWDTEDATGDLLTFDLADDEEDLKAPVKVFGYFPHWVHHKNPRLWRRLSWDLLSHFALFHFPLRPDGVIDESKAQIFGDSLHEIAQKAQDTDTTFLLTVTCFDETLHRYILSNDARRREVVENIVNLIGEYEADGVALDFEAIPVDQRTSFTLFVAELAVKAQEKDYEIVVAVPLLDYSDDHTAFDLKKITDAADFVFVMGYDVHHVGSVNTGALAPFDSVYASIDSLMDVIGPDNSEKVLLGVGHYGVEWLCAGDRAGAPVLARGSSLPFNEISKLVNDPEQGVRTDWSIDDQAPFFKRASDGYDQGGYSQGGYSQGQGGYSQGGYSQGQGGYSQGGYGQGGYGQGGYSQGGYSQGQGGYGQGGYSQGGYSQGQGGYSQGQGGYGQGGYSQGGYSQGQGGYSQGGYSQGGYNQAGYNQAGYNQAGHGQSPYADSLSALQVDQQPPQLWRQCWYEDEQSLRAKYQVVNAGGLAGVGIWALGYDNGNLTHSMVTYFHDEAKNRNTIHRAPRRS